MSHLYFSKALEKILYFSSIYKTSFPKKALQSFCFCLPSPFSVLVSEPLCVLSVWLCLPPRHKVMALNISPVKWSALQA